MNLELACKKDVLLFTVMSGTKAQKKGKIKLLICRQDWRQNTHKKSSTIEAAALWVFGSIQGQSSDPHFRGNLSRGPRVSELRGFLLRQFVVKVYKTGAPLFSVQNSWENPGGRI